MSHFLKKAGDHMERCIREISENISSYTIPGSNAFTRKSKFEASDMIKLMLSLSMKGLKNSIADYYLHYSGGHIEKTITVSAYTQKRNQLNDRLFPDLYRRIEDYYDLPEEDGLKIMAADGSDITIPYDPTDPAACFRQKDGQEYNIFHVNALFNITDGTFSDIQLEDRRKSWEVDALDTMMKRRTWQGPTLVIADRGYGYYTPMVNLDRTGDYFLFRINDPNKNGILPSSTPENTEFDLSREVILRRIKKRGKSGIERVCYKRYIAKQVKEDSDTYFLNLRLISVQLPNKQFIYYATNLEREKYDPARISALYRRRWTIETAFRRLKHELGLKYMHSKKKRYIQMEVYARIINFNFSARLAGYAEIRRMKKDEERRKREAARLAKSRFSRTAGTIRLFHYPRKVCFKKVITFARHFLITNFSDDLQFDELLDVLARETEAIRDGRSYWHRSARLPLTPPALIVA